MAGELRFVLRRRVPIFTRWSNSSNTAIFAKGPRPLKCNGDNALRPSKNSRDRPLADLIQPDLEKFRGRWQFLG